MTRSKVKEFIPKEAAEFRNDAVLKALRHAIKANKPALLTGETGTGKTSAIRFLAKELNAGFRRLNLNGASTVDDIIGKVLLNKEGTVWVDGVLTDAVRNGYWLLLDEVNAALPEVLFAIHSLIDDDGMLVLAENEGEVLRPHPDFRLFAALNPNYAGTRALNRAFISRFHLVINFDFLSKEDEVKLLMERTNVSEENALKMVDVADNLRANYKEGNISMPVSFRELMSWAKLIDEFSLDEAFSLAVVNKCYSDALEREVIFDAFKLI